MSPLENPVSTLAGAFSQVSHMPLILSPCSQSTSGRSCAIKILLHVWEDQARRSCAGMHGSLNDPFKRSHARLTVHLCSGITGPTSRGEGSHLAKLARTQNNFR